MHCCFFLSYSTKGCSGTSACCLRTVFVYHLLPELKYVRQMPILTRAIYPLISRNPSQWPRSERETIKCHRAWRQGESMVRREGRRRSFASLSLPRTFCCFTSSDRPVLAGLPGAGGECVWGSLQQVWQECVPCTVLLLKPVSFCFHVSIDLPSLKCALQLLLLPSYLRRGNKRFQVRLPDVSPRCLTVVFHLL